MTFCQNVSKHISLEVTVNHTDEYYLANNFDFDGATLTEALKKTFENRGHHFTVEQFEQVMAFGSDDAMQKKRKAFCKNR